MTVWKAVDGWERLYEVSNTGLVRSLPKGDGNGNRMRLLKPDTNTRGYKRVTLCRFGKPTRHSVHRLVAQAFLPNPQNLPWINHLDSDPTNNSVGNLEWCDPKGNAMHSASKGRQTIPRLLGGRAMSEKAAVRAMKVWSERIEGKLLGTYMQKRGGKQRRVLAFLCADCGAHTTAFHKDAPVRHGGRCKSCIRG